MHPIVSKMLSCGFVATLGLRTCVAADANLLFNGDFSRRESISGWSDNFSPPRDLTSWSSEDADANTQSGSLQVSSDGTSVSGMETVFSRCFAIVPGAAFSYGGKSRTLVGSGGITKFDCKTFSDAACLSGSTDLTPSPTVPNNTMWSDIAPKSGSLPGGNEYAQCAIRIMGQGSSQSVTQLFDDLFFTSAPPDRIFSSSFEN